MNNESIITVKTPAAFDKEVCLQLQNKAEEIYLLHKNKIQITGPAITIFSQFQEKLAEGYSYQPTAHSTHLNDFGVLAVTLLKPKSLQADEIVKVREEAKAEYEASLKAEKEMQIALLIEQQLQSHMKKEKEKEAAKMFKLRQQFEADAIACYANVKTSDENE